MEVNTVIKRRYLYFILFLSFILGSYNGNVALWRSGSDKPLQVFPYSIRSFPPSDQLRLQKGIPIQSWEQLQMLLQDYLS